MMNLTPNAWPCSVDDANYVVMLLYVPVGLLALVANVLIITVVIKFHYMRNITNYFLVNLSIADLLVTIVCMPNGAWSAYTLSWIFGECTCKLRSFLQCISVASSVFTITAMALDRYVAINQPFAFGATTRRTTMLLVGLMWALPMAIFSPLLYVTTLGVEVWPEECGAPAVVYCYEEWARVERLLPRRVFGAISFLTMFGVPGALVLAAYAMMGRKLCSRRPPSDASRCTTQQSFRIVRERKRVAWILLLLVAVFAVCWLPYNTLKLLQDLGVAAHAVAADQYTLLLGHLNSALNPIVYCAMSKNFRKSVRELLRRAPRPAGSSRRLQVQWGDSSASVQKVGLQPINVAHPRQPHPQMTLSRQHSSQKTTKTCAV